MNSENYLIVTPCKNEEKFLPYLAKSIIDQTIKPKIWFIYEDGSNDKSYEILSNLSKSYDWIYIKKGEKFKRDLSFHISDIVDTSIKEALLICSNKNIDIDYFGQIDADMVLDRDFFEKIIKKFRDNSKLGIASGTVTYKEGKNIIIEKGRDNQPNGGLRVWRKKCFIETGGFPKSYSADSVSNVLAKLKGWEIRIFNDISGIHLRKTSSAEGLWKGFRVRGESDYYRDYHPIYILLKFLKYTIQPPFYTGISYINSYVNCVLKRKNKMMDHPEVRKYYRNKHLEIIDYYKKKIKH